MKKNKITLVQNTHWDYEWYFTTYQSNVLFHFHMKELLYALDNNLIENYIIDGQTTIIETYLQMFPEDKEKLIKYNKEGRLKIGPWYTQTDQMIISTESIVKNLLLGHKQSEELGGTWKIAYAPDIFGQAENMPSIYNGFGMENFLFWRGLNPNRCDSKEFIWKGNDGSKVNTYNIKEGYNRAPFITTDDEEMNLKAIEEMKKSSIINGHDVYSLGSDQRHIDLDIKDVIKKLNEKYPENEFVLGDYEDYFNNYKDLELKEVEGEFLDASNSKIHRSIYSHRYDHKFLNDYVERLLTYTLEPLKAMASKAGIKTLVSSTEEIWKLLLLNSAHDSAGGCNSDITNEHITNRFLKAKEITESYIDILIRKIVEKAYKEGDIVLFNSQWSGASGEQGDKNDLVLFNTSQSKKTSFKNVKIISETPDFKLFDDEKELEFQVMNVEKIYAGSIRRTIEEHDPNLYYYSSTVAVKVDVDPYSIKGIQVVLNNGVDNLVEASDQNFIENDKYKITFSNKEFSILDKDNNNLYNNFIELISDADDGDTYDFSPLPNAERQKVILIDPEIKTYSGNIINKMEINSKIFLNKNIDEFINKTNSKIEQDLNLEISLYENRVEFNIKTENKAKDTRLRIRFNTDIKYNESISDTHYGFVHRPIIQNEMNTWKQDGWYEEPTGIYPVISTVIAKDEEKQISFLLNGIKEYEFYPNGQVELTLYRTIGWLGKPDLERRPGIASGQQYRWIETPDSQLINKKLEWNFSLVFDMKEPAEIYNERMKYATIETYYQDQNLDRFTGPLRYFVVNKNLDDIEKDSSLFKKFNLNEKATISILKQISEDEILLRIFNSSENEINNSLSLELSEGVNVFDSNFLEERHEQLNTSDKFELGSLRKGQIRTLIIKYK